MPQPLRVVYGRSAGIESGLGGLDQGIQVGARHSPMDGITEEPAFATEHERSNGVLAAVVVDGHFAVSEKGGQLRPLTKGVVLFKKGREDKSFVSVSPVAEA